MDNEKITPASLGMYSVFTRDTKRGRMYDVKRLIGFVYTARGEIIRPCWQRVYTLSYYLYAFIVCNAFNAAARERFFKYIKVLECYGDCYAVFLSGAISDGAISRINCDTITLNLSVEPKVDVNLYQMPPLMFSLYEHYINYINVFCTH